MFGLKILKWFVRVLVPRTQDVVHDLSQLSPALVVWHENDAGVSRHDTLCHWECRPRTVNGSPAFHKVCHNS
jgi:hypothetical protein